MEASILDLRRRMADVLRALDRNEPVKVLYRGRERAILVPAGHARQLAGPVRDHPAFGMWKDRKDMEDVAGHIGQLRQGRFHAA